MPDVTPVDPRFMTSENQYPMSNDYVGELRGNRFIPPPDDTEETVYANSVEIGLQPIYCHNRSIFRDGIRELQTDEHVYEDITTNA